MLLSKLRKWEKLEEVPKAKAKRASRAKPKEEPVEEQREEPKDEQQEEPKEEHQSESKVVRPDFGEQVSAKTLKCSHGPGSQELRNQKTKS